MRSIAFALSLCVLSCGGSTDAGPATDAGTSPSIDELESNVCADAVTLPCSEFATTADCRAQLQEGRKEATTAGCSAEWNNLMACVDAHSLVCDSPTDMTVDPACESAVDAMDACGNGSVATPACSIGMSGGAGIDGGTTESCTVACDSYSVECSGPSGSLTCTCSAGPRQGNTFTADDCYPTDSFASYCQ